MADGETSSKILPYRFEPVSVSNYSDPDTSSSKSETNIREQASFTEQLEAQAGASVQNVHPCPVVSSVTDARKWMVLSNMWLRMKAIKDHKQFKVVCINIDILYTALVMMNMIRGDPVCLPLPNR